MSSKNVAKISFCLLVIIGCLRTVAPESLFETGLINRFVAPFVPQTRVFADEYFFIPTRMTLEDESGQSITFLVDYRIVTTLFTGSIYHARPLYLALTRPHILGRRALTQILRTSVCAEPSFQSFFGLEPLSFVSIAFVDAAGGKLPVTPFRVKCRE